MKRNFKLVLTFIFAFVILVGCAKTDNKKNEAAKPEEKPKESETIDLKDWNGNWNNMGVYLENPDVQDAYKKLAEKENISEEEAKEAYLEKRKADFDGLKIEGNKITILDKRADEEGNIIDESEYEFVEEKVAMLGDHELHWNIFKAKNEDAKYKFFMLMPIDKGEELLHFHMRYGSDVDEMLKMEKWFPTFVDISTTDKLISDEIAE